MYKIDDVTEATKPLPPTVGRKVKYPLRDMKVGQTFFVPCGSRKPENVRGSIANSASRFLGKGFIKTQVRAENGIDGVRVWRIK